MNSKFQDTLMKYMMPIANKVEQQKHLQTIKDDRHRSVRKYLYGRLPEHGIKTLLYSGKSKKHEEYLLKMGFIPENDVYKKAAGIAAEKLFINSVIFYLIAGDSCVII